MTAGVLGLVAVLADGFGPGSGPAGRYWIFQATAAALLLVAAALAGLGAAWRAGRPR
ncbi:MAG: hypothetical protein ACR2FU_08315 [Streptosporangiaceae bacterium]